ncbi:metallophosphoesterase [Mariniblastus sp.]|nr:metallophosphoesterase [bacterium]MDC3223710.1 metallophosphoesterase [Mariniblastus sp.]
MKKFISSRRDFFGTTAAVATSIILPQRVMACLERVKKPIKLGMIADLHQDVMHDGPARLQAFLDAMKEENPDALIQLGDFAYPIKKNEVVSKAFEKAHAKTLHVLGNHEIDDGHSFDEVAKLWGMKGRYYTEHVNGLDLVVLDGNEKPENHQGGYPAHIGEEQLEWLAKQLKTLQGPILVICHQPLAGPSCIDNAEEVQTLLNSAADKVLLAVNGHTHIDHVARVGKISYLHVNSASYKWVGGSYRNKSYPAEVHSKFQWVEYTCPYRDSLFTTLTIDPASGRIDVQGRESEWVGKSPSQLGIADKPDLTDGKEICPKIRSRQLGPAEK